MKIRHHVIHSAIYVVVLVACHFTFSQKVFGAGAASRGKTSA